MLNVRNWFTYSGQLLALATWIWDQQLVLTLKIGDISAENEIKMLIGVGKRNDKNLEKS